MFSLIRRSFPHIMFILKDINMDFHAANRGYLMVSVLRLSLVVLHLCGSLVD